MKKLLVLLSLCFMPMMVKADMAAPVIKGYEIEVVNPDGVATYKNECDSDYSNCKLVKNGLLVYGDVCSVYSEEEINNEIYVYAECPTYNKNYMFKLSDVTILHQNFTLNDSGVEKLYPKVTEEVLADEINVHTGPAKGFEVIGTLKKGTVVEFIYTYYGSGWYYVEVNGLKGWVCELDGNIGRKLLGKMITTQDAELVDYNGKKVATIPRDTIFESYYRMDDWSKRYYVTYNGVSGYLENEMLAGKYEKSLYIIRDLKLFNTYLDAKDYLDTRWSDDEETIDRSVATVPSGEIVDAKFYYKFPTGLGQSDYYLIDYNNHDYWVIGEMGNWGLCEYAGEKTYVFSGSINIYDKLDDGNIIGTIEEHNEYFKLCDGYIKYVEYGDIKGYIDDTSNEEIKDEVDNTEDEEIIIESKGLSKNEIIYLSVGIVVACVLSSVVTIIIVNKKRKKGSRINGQE